MIKPFRFEELLARVKLRLRDRHLPTSQDEMVLRVGNIVLDLHTRQVRVGDRVLELSAKEFIMLEVFLCHLVTSSLLRTVTQFGLGLGLRSW